MDLKEAPQFPGYQACDNGIIYKDELVCETRYVGKYVHVKMEYCEIKRATLVCLIFHGPRPFLKAMVLHENDVPDDDRPLNLRWGTRSENTIDSTRNGTHPVAKLTAKDVKEIRQLHAEGRKRKDIAYIFGVCGSTIYSIISGKTWAHVDGP